MLPCSHFTDEKTRAQVSLALGEEGVPLGPAAGLLCALGEALATFCLDGADDCLIGAGAPAVAGNLDAGLWPVPPRPCFSPGHWVDSCSHF